MKERISLHQVQKQLNGELQIFSEQQVAKYVQACNYLEKET